MHGFQSDKITNINYNKNNYNKNTIKIKDLKRLIKTCFTRRGGGGETLTPHFWLQDNCLASWAYL